MFCTVCNIERRPSEVIKDSEGNIRCPYCLEIIEETDNSTEEN
jgi:hypothetical protein